MTNNDPRDWPDDEKAALLAAMEADQYRSDPLCETCGMPASRCATVLERSAGSVHHCCPECECGDSARRVLEYVLHLRMNGERAPGGDETWQEADRLVEGWLRHHTGDA